MSQAPTREVARRVFATEFNDAGFTFKESDDERAPLYALLPTGERVNRIFAVGTLTETEDIGDDNEYWRGRVVDPTGTFFVYAGQYQPDAAAFLRDADTPSYVSLTGKPRTYETDEGDINVSVRPEAINAVGEDVRDRWVVETAERTMERIEAFDDEGNEYAQRAREEYGEDLSRYKQALIDALEDLDAAGESAADAESAPEPSP